MKEAMKFAVFPDVAEYHATKEISFIYHDSACGKVKGVSLNSLCGAYVGPVTKPGESSVNGAATTRLYDQPPAEFVLCRTCERLMTKRSGWRRVLSHLFNRWSGFRVAFR